MYNVHACLCVCEGGNTHDSRVNELEKLLLHYYFRRRVIQQSKHQRHKVQSSFCPPLYIYIFFFSVHEAYNNNKFQFFTQTRTHRQSRALAFMGIALLARFVLLLSGSRTWQPLSSLLSAIYALYALLLNKFIMPTHTHTLRWKGDIQKSARYEDQKILL